MGSFSTEFANSLKSVCETRFLLLDFEIDLLFHINVVQAIVLSCVQVFLEGKSM